MLRKELIRVIILIIVFFVVYRWYIDGLRLHGNRERVRRTQCIQSLGTWRRVIEMYASDHEKGWYPKELSGRYGDPSDGMLLTALAKYTNITNTLRACDSILFSSVTTEGYTITGQARDRNKTILTATPEGVQQP